MSRIHSASALVLATVFLVSGASFPTESFAQAQAQPQQQAQNGSNARNGTSQTAGRCTAARMRRPQTHRDACTDVNQKLDIEKSRWAYQNPDSRCDLGLQLPGLPDFGVSIGGLSACKLLKMVTSKTVEEINKASQRAVQDAVKGATDAIGLDDTKVDTDIGEMLGIEGDTRSKNDLLNSNQGAEENRARQRQQQQQRR